MTKKLTERIILRVDLDNANYLRSKDNLSKFMRELLEANRIMEGDRKLKDATCKRIERSIKYHEKKALAAAKHE